MSLDARVNKHLDVMDKIEDSIDTDVITIVDGINIDAIMENPETAMLAVSGELLLMMEEYAVQGAAAGFDFAKMIDEARKDIKVDPAPSFEGER